MCGFYLAGTRHSDPNQAPEFARFPSQDFHWADVWPCCRSTVIQQPCETKKRKDGHQAAPRARCPGYFLQVEGIETPAVRTLVLLGSPSPSRYDASEA